MNKMIRTILPVGQGGFYTENFFFENKELLIVYDCGSEAKKKLTVAIQSALPDNRDIDILFISHFDSDHVNGIKELAKHHRIHKVVMPQIDGLEWLYFISNAVVKGNGYNPELVAQVRSVLYENDIHIIQVAPYIEGEENTNPVSIESLSDNRTISSGCKIQGIPFWEYIPINTVSKSQIDDLEYHLLQIFHSKYPQINSIDQLSGEEIAEVINDYRSEINEIYKYVFGDANKASMCLYSGGFDSEKFKVHIVSNHCYCYCLFSGSHFYKSEACLYTGDANLTNNSLKSAITTILANRIKRIGTLQIPHHGSIHNSSAESIAALVPNHPLLFVSYGTNNRHKHPSLYLLNSLRAESYCIHEVTEFRDTTLVESINFYVKQ